MSPSTWTGMTRGRVVTLSTGSWTGKTSTWCNTHLWSTTRLFDGILDLFQEKRRHSHSFKTKTSALGEGWTCRINMDINPIPNDNLGSLWQDTQYYQMRLDQQPQQKTIHEKQSCITHTSCTNRMFMERRQQQKCHLLTQLLSEMKGQRILGYNSFPRTFTQRQSPWLLRRFVFHRFFDKQTFLTPVHFVWKC